MNIRVTIQINNKNPTTKDKISVACKLLLYVKNQLDRKLNSANRQLISAVKYCSENKICFHVGHPLLPTKNNWDLTRLNLTGGAVIPILKLLIVALINEYDDEIDGITTRLKTLDDKLAKENFSRDKCRQCKSWRCQNLRTGLVCANCFRFICKDCLNVIYQTEPCSRCSRTDIYCQACLTKYDGTGNTKPQYDYLCAHKCKVGRICYTCRRIHRCYKKCQICKEGLFD